MVRYWSWFGFMFWVDYFDVECARMRMKDWLGRLYWSYNEWKPKGDIDVLVLKWSIGKVSITSTWCQVWRYLCYWWNCFGWPMTFDMADFFYCEGQFKLLIEKCWEEETESVNLNPSTINELAILTHLRHGVIKCAQLLNFHFGYL